MATERADLPRARGRACRAGVTKIVTNNLDMAADYLGRLREEAASNAQAHMELTTTQHQQLDATVSQLSETQATVVVAVEVRARGPRAWHAPRRGARGWGWRLKTSRKAHAHAQRGHLGRGARRTGGAGVAL